MPSKDDRLPYPADPAGVDGNTFENRLMGVRDLFKERDNTGILAQPFLGETDAGQSLRAILLNALYPRRHLRLEICPICPIPRSFIEGRDERVPLSHDYLASDAWMTLRAAAISGSVQSYPSMAWFITAHRRTCSL